MNRKYGNYGSSTLIAALLAGTTLISGAMADELSVMGLEVHMNNMRASGFAEGGVDNLADFEARTGSTVRFVTGTVNSLQESLQRLGTLSSTEEDVIYVNQLDANSRLTTFLSPITHVLPDDAVEGFPDQWSADVLASATFEDDLYLLPLRCGTFTLWYNERIFDEFGISAPPETPDELYEMARELTFTRDSGEQVFGFLPRGDRWSLTEDMTVLARMYGGDLITQDFEVVINQPPAVAAVELLQRMYREGIMPPNWASVDGSTIQELFRNERAAIILGGANYHGQLNLLSGSRVSGYAVPAHMPLIEELQTEEVRFSPSTIWYWGVGILSGANDKDLAEEFIQEIAQPTVQMELANNGNGPCTTGVLAQMATEDPGMALAAEIFEVSRPTVPAHPNMNQVRDVMGEAIQDIIVNDLDAQQELDRVADRVERILR